MRSDASKIVGLMPARSNSYAATIPAAPAPMIATSPAGGCVAKEAIGSVGLIEVKDNRPSAPGWTLSVSSSSFANGPNTIAAASASIAPGTVSTPNGSSLTGVSAGAGGSLDVSRSLMTATATNGLGTYDVTPTDTVQIGTAVKSGTYSATLTITVS